MSPGRSACRSAATGPQALEYEREQAAVKAEEGAGLARQTGSTARAIAIRCDGLIAAALIDYINQQCPRLVVMGTRGLTGLHSAIAGSVSHSVSAHLHVPILVVPPEDAPPRTR